MQRRTTVTEIALVILGLILACCWLPRGLSGLIFLARALTPALRPPSIVDQVLRFWADPLTWCNQWLLASAVRFSPRIALGLAAFPNCLCGVAAIAIVGVVIFLAVRARRGTQPEEA